MDKKKSIISEFGTAEDLRPFVQAYWEGDFNNRNHQMLEQAVVPNGCLELIIHLDNAHCLLSHDELIWQSTPPFLILGVYDKPYVVKFSENVRVFAIRFFPDGFKQIFGIDPGVVQSKYEAGDSVLGKCLSDFCNRIREMKQTERIAFTNSFLCQNLAQHYVSHDYTHMAMRKIRKQNGIIDHKWLTDQIPISQRQLQRNFRSVYGMKISDYMRLTRLNAIQNYLNLESKQVLTDLTYEFGFSDQSHFNKEFRNYVGESPLKFIRNRENYLINPALCKD